MRYAEWKDEVAAEYSAQFGLDIEDLRLSEAVMKNYWHEGYSPAEYVQDMADGMKQDIEEEAFDLRYDL